MNAKSTNDMKRKIAKVDITAKSINDIPDGVIRWNLLPFLSFQDVISFGIALEKVHKRFKESVEYTIKKRSKS